MKIEDLEKLSEKERIEKIGLHATMGKRTGFLCDDLVTAERYCDAVNKQYPKVRARIIGPIPISVGKARVMACEAIPLVPAPIVKLGSCPCGLTTTTAKIGDIFYIDVENPVMGTWQCHCGRKERMAAVWAGGWEGCEPGFMPKALFEE